MTHSYIRYVPFHRYILFGDFGIGFEGMQESTILGAYGVLFMLSILLTLVMMNIFIAVVSDVYGKAFESAQLEFEKTVVDYSFYNMRSNDIRDLMIDHYLAQVKDITKKKLKELAREIHKSEKETQPEHHCHCLAGRHLPQPPVFHSHTSPALLHALRT